MYKKRRNTNYKSIGNTGLETSSEISARSSDVEFYELETAEVVDVILTSNHDDFITWEDIGKVKFRFIESQTNKPESQLFYARPFNSNIQKYPLIHELVLIGNFHGNFYYIGTLNKRLNINHNEAPFASVDPNAKGTSESRNNYQEASTGLGSSENSQSQVTLGDEFEVNNDVKPLKFNEGDVVLQGRFAQSIRFGSNSDTLNPTIKIRCGQFEDASNRDRLERITEDINEDPSSLYLSEDETINLTPATEDLSVHYTSPETTPNEFDGKQILATSDRLIFDAKRDKIMTFSRGSTNITSGQNFTYDVEENVITSVLGDRNHTTEGSITEEIGGSWTKNVSDNIEITTDSNLNVNVSNNTVIDSSQIFVGSSNANEPLVLGNTLVQLLNELLTALQSETHPSPVGPTSPPTNASQYADIQSQLQSALSDTNFTE